MKFAFVWYWDRASEIFPDWRDGLRAALEYIELNHHQVDYYLDKTVPPPDADYDAILFWDDSNSAFFNELHKYKAKKGIILTTDPQNYDNLRLLDVVFCESTPVYEKVRRQGIRAMKAFGTDTDFFKPDTSVKKDIEYFYPATFSPWKRQSSIAHYGKDLLCVGTVQPDGQYELEECQKNGVQVEIGYFPVEKIREYYRRAKHVLIPAIHGSERTLLESMSMNIVPQVNQDNIRTHSYLDEYREAKCFVPREFVKENYSHVLYGKNILHGFL